ncbi:MAG TPA: VOC family protein, partial [Myxococcota bacterium]
MKLHHVAVAVADLARARAFYEGVLGLAVVREQPHAIWVDAEDTIVMLELERPAHRDREHREHREHPRVLAFAIDAGEHAVWRDKLARAGVVIESESDFTIYVR